MAAMARAEPGRSWDPGTAFRSTTWIADNLPPEPPPTDSQDLHYQETETGRQANLQLQALSHDMGRLTSILTARTNVQAWVHLSLKLLFICFYFN